MVPVLDLEIYWTTVSPTFVGHNKLIYFSALSSLSLYIIDKPKKFGLAGIFFLLHVGSIDVGSSNVKKRWVFVIISI